MKKRNLLLFFTIILSLLSIQVSAQYFGWDWNEGDCKSTNDPLYMELPDSIHAMVPTNVKIYINDPIVKEYANYIEVQVGNSQIYQTTGPKPSRSSGGHYRETLPYNGEDTIEFGFRQQDRVGYPQSIVVTFSIAKEAPGLEWPDTGDEDSPFYQYGCHHERNSLMCNKEDGCMICHHEIGQISKNFMISETDETVSIPSRVDFVDEKAENNYMSVASQHLSYNEQKKYIGGQGNEYESSDIYTISLNTQEIWDTFEAYKENDLDGYSSQKDNLKNPDVVANDISVGGPELSGKAYEMVYNKALNPQNGADFVDIYYQLFAEMAPVGSGIMIIQATRQTVFTKGTGSEAELEAVRNDVLNMLSSYKLSKGTVVENKDHDYFSFKWYTKGEPVEEETTEDYYVAGHISDYFDHPMSYMEIVAKIDGIRYEGMTDKDGIYKIPLVGLELKEGEEKDVILLAKLNYVRDGKNYFDIQFRKPNGRYTLVQTFKKDKLVEGEHLQIDFRMDGEGDFVANIPDKLDLKHYSLNYFHTAESVEFVLETLKETLDHRLPISIFVGNRNKDTLYSPTDSKILISADDASLSDSDRPDNREYHEFMHALMYDVYGTWPEGRRLAGTVNHNGYHNPSTADSYMEGFAEFMAMVISDEMGEPNPQLYAGFGSMDQNYKMWDGKGFDEEFAIASLLWDMYDEYNEKGDELSMTIEDMWKVLKIKRKDFYEYYKAFKVEFPKKADAIDKLFILHGIYDDTREGNHNYDVGEPLRYEGEGHNRQGYYIDLSGNITKASIEWENNLTIGKSAEYNRPSRSSAGRIPGAFLKIEDNEVDFYKIIISSEDFTYEYIVDRKDELIYIHPLPLNSDATITVTPFSKDYMAKEVFTINSEELNEKIYSGNIDEEPLEYFDEHEFNLEKTGTEEDEKYELFDGVKPTYDYEGDLGKEVKIKVDDSVEFDIGSSSKIRSKFSFGKMLLFLLIVIFVYFYFKKPKFKKKSNDFFSQVFSRIKKAVKWFIKYMIPFILKAIQWVIKFLVKLFKLIFHHSKKAYHKAKPHVKVVHKNIKKKINEKKSKNKKN